MRYLIMFLIIALPVMAFAAGQDVSAAPIADADTWTNWVRDSSIGKLAAALLLNVTLLGVTRIRGAVTDRGGTLAAALLALFGGIISSVVDGTPFDPKLIETILVVGVTAVGGYTVVKKLAFPTDQPVSAPISPPTRFPADLPINATVSEVESLVPQKGGGTASGELDGGP